MRVLLVAAGQDTGGQGFRIKEALERHVPGWSAASFAASQTYLRFPGDQPWDLRALRAEYRQADVVHVRNNFIPYRWLDRHDRKPLVISHHGTAFRRDAGSLMRRARSHRATSLVSTIDLLGLGEGLRWLPSPQDVPALRRIGDLHRTPSDRIRVAHAPTARRIKSTDEFLGAMERLARRYPVETVLIEHAAWDDCLRRKAVADIYFDQAILGYGNNALEAWAMGIPVVAGAAPETLARMRSIIGSELPFYETTPDEVETALEALIADEALRREYARRGTEYVEEWHDYPRVAEFLAEVYADTVEMRRAA